MPPAKTYTSIIKHQKVNHKANWYLLPLRSGFHYKWYQQKLNTTLTMQEYFLKLIAPQRLTNYATSCSSSLIYCHTCQDGKQRISLFYRVDQLTHLSLYDTMITIFMITIFSYNITSECLLSRKLHTNETGEELNKRIWSTWILRPLFALSSSNS